MVDNDKESIRREQEIEQLLLCEVSEENISALNTHADAYAKMGNYEKAIQLQQQVLSLCNKLDAPHQRLEIFHIDMGRYHYLDGDFKNAADAWEHALKIVEKFSSHYENLLKGLAYIYTETNDKENLFRLFGLMQEHNEHELGKPCTTPKEILERAEYHGLTGNPATARKYYSQVLQMNIDDETKTEAYEKFASFLWKQNDYVGAAENYLMAANLWKSYKEKDGHYAKDMLSAARLYYQGGMYSRAIEVYQEASDVFTASTDPLAPQHVVECWKEIGNAYMADKEYDLATKWYLKLMHHLEDRQSMDKDYPKAILLLAKAEKLNEEYDKSIGHHLTAMELFKHLDMMTDYIDSVSSLKFCLLYAKKKMVVPFDEERADVALKASIDHLLNDVIESHDINHTYMGKLEHAKDLSIIAGLYHMRADHSHAEEYYRQLLPVLRDAIRDIFRLQDERQRMETWSPMISTIHDIKATLVDSLQGGKETEGGMATVAYDALLLSKGILLNSSIEFEKVLEKMNDKDLVEILKQIRANEKELEKLRQSKDYANSLEIAISLSQCNQDLQILLYERCAEFADFTDYISYDWRDVQKRLTVADIAIEFMEYNKFSENEEESEKMVALVLTKEMDKPVAVKIWDNDNLKKWSKTDEYQLWERTILDNIAKGSFDFKLIASIKEKIMNSSLSFKPEMLLLLQNLEDDMRARYTYRPAFIGLDMMTYRQLLSGNAIFQTDAAGAIIWGRLQKYLEGKSRVFFSADGCFHLFAIEYLPLCGFFFSEFYEVYRLSSTKVLCHNHSQRDIQKAVLIGDINYDSTSKGTLLGNASETTKNNDKIVRLAMSSRELFQIQSVLESGGVKQIQIISGSEASNASFMALSGSDLDVLHIITHGYFNVQKDSTDRDALKKCLLALAGAGTDNNAFVSGEEIARMNFRHCEFVCLSACNTGYGKLGADGVFGLQRAFKNAGIHTLLMSLNSVEDSMTADLMSLFYQLLMDGESKRSALVKAQQRIRRTNKKGCKYWTNIILLDAI